MEFEAAQILGKLIGAGLAMIGAIGAGAGIGIVTSGAVQAMGRNPDATGTIQTNMILGIAFAEAVAIYCHSRLRPPRWCRARKPNAWCNWPARSLRASSPPWLPTWERAAAPSHLPWPANSPAAASLPPISAKRRWPLHSATPQGSASTLSSFDTPSDRGLVPFQRPI